MSVTPRTFTSFSNASAIIRKMIVEGSHTAPVLDTAAELVRDLVPLGKAAQAQALWQYVRDSVLYLEDPYSDDHFQSPEVTMRRGAGDCDDQVILLGALLRSIGIGVCLVFVFDAPPTGETFEFPSHVYLEGDVGQVQGETYYVAMETIPVPGPGGGFYYPKFATNQMGKGYLEKVKVG